MVTQRTYTMETDKQTVITQNQNDAAKSMIDVELASEATNNQTNIVGSKRKEIPSATGIETPNDNDILSGRGAGINLHPGNVYYRKLVQSYKLQYVNSDPAEKKRIIKCVFNIAKQYGRFLKLDPSTEEWTRVSDAEAKRKVGQALRENATEIKKQNDQKVLKGKLEFQTAKSKSIPGYLHPRLGFDLVSSLTRPTSIQTKSDTSITSQILSPCQPSRFTQISELWHRVNVLQQKQDDLKRKQREFEEDQNQLMLHLYQQMTKPTSFEAPSSDVSWSSYSSDEYSLSPLSKKRRKIIES